jgi:hypothetical protein
VRGLPRAGCHRHADDLLAFADDRDIAAVDAAALAHLDTCPDCRREVEQAALAAVALRRLGAVAADVEPSADVWPRLQARLTRRPVAWRWRAPLAGLLVSAAVVAVALTPAAWLRPPDPYIQEVGLQASIFDARRAAEDRSEAEALQKQLAIRARPIPHDDPAAAPASVGAAWLGPDGLGLGRDVAPAVVIQPRHE